MRSRPYYSIRTGKASEKLDYSLEAILGLFQTFFRKFEDQGYFQADLGYHCVDAGYVPGSLGLNEEGAVLLKLHRKGLTPVRTKILGYDEADLFDAIEFLFDCCSRPTSSWYHDYSNCGLHCESSDKAQGQAEYQKLANEILGRYDGGYELSADGEVLHLADDGLEPLLSAELPHQDKSSVLDRVRSAQVKFRRYKSSIDDRRDAIRDLVDVLEYLRPKVKDVLKSKDESDLFNIANNFGIRHHNPRQQLEYDAAIWHSWMFYFYLATIHACVRLIEKSGGLP